MQLHERFRARRRTAEAQLHKLARRIRIEHPDDVVLAERAADGP